MRKLIMFLTMFLFVVTASAYAGDVVVIVNNDVGLASVSRTELQQIFLGKVVNWSSGQKATPVTLKSGAVHEEFLKSYLGKSPSQFDTFWKQAIFTGTGRPPKSVGSDADVVQFVSGTNGAVGYISAKSAHAGVKVLDVK